MRSTVIVAAALFSLGGCLQIAKDVHTEHALEECDNLVDLSERMACENSVRTERHDRDMKDRAEKSS